MGVAWGRTGALAARYPSGIVSPVPYDMPSPTLLERIAGWPWEETLAVAFAAVWGGMLGSFLNVLAYRVPLGRTPLTGRSSCPRCGAPVRFRDNVPVIGWLVLGGRCRDCHGPIPVSYVLVEAGCALAAAVLAAAAVAAGGMESVLRGDNGPLCRWGLQLAAVLTVVARSLLDADSSPPANGRPERRLAIRAWTALPAVAIACGAAWLAPRCGPLAWPGNWPWPQDAGLRCGLAAAAGGLTGWAAGLATTPTARGSLAILGSVLGWQGVTVATILTVATAAAGGRLGSPRTLGLLAAAWATAVLAAATWACT